MNLYPEAIWQPGPPEMVWGFVNVNHGAICHSAEGHWSDAYTPIDTMRQQGTSWHFTVMQDGSVWQHYRLDASPWHAGDAQANGRLIGIEHEGVAGEPLTPLQLAASVKLVRWIAQQGMWAPTRPGTLWEHREINDATQCPSDRIPWDAYIEEGGVEPVKVVNADAIAAVKAAVTAVGQQDGDYLATAGSGRVAFDVPAGKRAIIAVVKED